MGQLEGFSNRTLANLLNPSNGTSTGECEAPPCPLLPPVKLYSSSAAHQPRGIPCNDCFAPDILYDNGSGTDHGSISHRDSRTDERVRTDPSLVSDGNRKLAQAHRRVAKVVAPAAEMGALGNRHLFADLHRPQTVE